jgi:hypothetical protein
MTRWFIAPLALLAVAACSTTTVEVPLATGTGAAIPHLRLQWWRPAVKSPLEPQS